MMDRCRPDEGEQADVNKNESKNAEALTISNRYISLALFARSTMRTTSDMMRFNSKSFGVYPLSWQKRTLRECVAMSANDPGCVKTSTSAARVEIFLRNCAI
jgi:hypothetical protein